MVVAVVDLAGVELKRWLLDVYSGAMLRDMRLLAFDADQSMGTPSDARAALDSTELIYLGSTLPRFAAALLARGVSQHIAGWLVVSAPAVLRLAMAAPTCTSDCLCTNGDG